MGIFSKIIRSGLDPASQKMLAWIEAEVEAGRMSHEEAERQRADVEKTLDGVFGSNKEKEEA